ncbi:MAG TPA: NfeD family protein [Chthoniobacterales bacterium]|jgi:membrane-bound serine protease (ClpP class)
MGIILLLAGVGFTLMLTEMFLPGGVLGILGGLALIGAAVVGYVNFGMAGGTLILVALGMLTLAGFCTWMKVFPRTAVGRRLTLASSLSSGDTMPESDGLAGLEGVAATTLRPAGKALIAGRRIDVVAEADFIEAGTPIVVIAVEGARVVVRKKI